MSQMLNMDNIYCTFPAERLEKVSVRLVKEVPVLADGYTVDSCEKAINLIGEELSQCDREYVAVLNLASDLKPINCSIVSIGTLNRSLVAPGDMVKTAILSNAANMLMIHTHPSGNLEPSDIDIMITKKMIFVCELVGIPLLDHIIIGGNNEKNYYSFREMSLIDFKRNYMNLDVDKSVWFDNVAEKKAEYENVMSR